MLQKLALAESSRKLSGVLVKKNSNNSSGFSDGGAKHGFKGSGSTGDAGVNTSNGCDGNAVGGGAEEREKAKETKTVDIHLSDPNLSIKQRVMLMKGQLHTPGNHTQNTQNTHADADAEAGDTIAPALKSMTLSPSPSRTNTHSHTHVQSASSPSPSASSPVSSPVSSPINKAKERSVKKEHRIHRRSTLKASNRAFTARRKR